MSDRLTDEQFAELLHTVPLTYEGGNEVLSDWAREWLGPDGGVLSLLNEVRNERERLRHEREESRDARRRIALAHRIHFQYLPAAVDFDCCAGCNRISGGYVPWPCETYKALTGGDDG
jgi:hypothetical protein